MSLLQSLCIIRAALSNHIQGEMIISVEIVQISRHVQLPRKQETRRKPGINIRPSFCAAKYEHAADAVKNQQPVCYSTLVAQTGS